MSVMEKEIYIVETVRDYCSDETTTDIDIFYTREEAINFINEQVDEELEEDDLSPDDADFAYYEEWSNRGYVNAWGDLMIWNLYKRTVNFD